jgi:hypothetical protein
MPSRTINYHRLAFDDVRKAQRWYYRRSPWAAERFTQPIRDAEAKIEAAADSYPVAYHNVRWLLLPDYPYIVRFQILDDHRCKIVSVAHSSRRPGHWVWRLSHP